MNTDLEENIIVIAVFIVIVVVVVVIFIGGLKFYLLLTCDSVCQFRQRLDSYDTMLADCLARERYTQQQCDRMIIEELDK